MIKQICILIMLIKMRIFTDIYILIIEKNIQIINLLIKCVLKRF